MSQGSNFPYCNVTSDLAQINVDIEKYHVVDVLENWEPHSTHADVYQKRATGYYAAVYDTGEALSVQTSAADVQSNAGSYYYDGTNDILYIHTADSDDPVSESIVITASTIGDWKTYKETMRNDAMELVESLVDPKFPRPLPFARNSYNSKKYDTDIVKSCAYLTCYLIIQDNQPGSQVAENLYQQVWDKANDRGILWEHMTGERAFSFETTADDFNGRLENLTLDASSTGRVYLAGTGENALHTIYRIKISTGGAVETAEFQVSDDDGRTYGDAVTTYNEFQHLADGIFIRFDGTFVADDEWKIEVAAQDLEHTNAQIKSRRWYR
jgi:hypothetical protein